MLFELDAMPAVARYRLLTSTITPRPIAWVTSLDPDGILNVAPFSCFNLMGHTPPTIALGIEARPDGSAKDSCANIRATGEMVINLVSAGHGEAMLRTAADFPPDVDEAAVVGLDLLPSAKVAPPRIATAPVSLECRSLHILELSPVQTIVIGEVLAAHVDPAAVIDAERAHVDTVALGLIGRMQGPGWYVRCENLFQLS